nr:retrotransposon protein, putative, Ty1-copia subclass [Tanacetum cinerariifolium]
MLSTRADHSPKPRSDQAEIDLAQNSGLRTRRLLRSGSSMAQPVQNINHSAFKSMFERKKLSGNNFNDWFHQLNMTPKLHRQFENYSPYEILQDLKSMFEKQARVMKGHLDQLERLGYMQPQDLIVGLILNDLTKDFARFVRNYNMHNMEKMISELHAMLIEYEKGLLEKAETPQHPAKDDTCHHCKEVGHWKRNCPVYLAELFKKKKQVGPSSSSDRGGEYISQEFKDYLKAYGIVQQLTPPYTPQHNGMSERRNHTLLDMVRSMMNLTTLLLSFCDYALESVTRILNMVPTKKVDKTPYELWYEKVLNLSYLKVWGCEALVKQDTPDKLQQRSVKYNMVWVLVDLPSGCKTVGSKWIFKKKTDMDGIVHTYKARLVAKGNTQLYGIDYEETFSPVANIRAIKILISIATYYDYEIWQMNVKTAFLNGYLDEDIYMVQPEDFIDPNHPRKASRSNVTLLILYVDDLIIMGNHIPSLQSVKNYLGKCFAMKDLGEVAFILEIKIYRDRSKRLIRLGQNAYMDKILRRYKMDNSKRGHIPMQETLDLNKTQGASTPKEVESMQNVPYASAVGSIMYTVRCTRPDVAYVLGLWWKSKAELRVDGYCDSGFETDRDYTKSQTGYVFILNGGAMDWKCSNQSTTAMSASKAEYIAVMEAVWIKKFISGLGRKIPESPWGFSILVGDGDGDVKRFPKEMRMRMGVINEDRHGKYDP